MDISSFQTEKDQKEFQELEIEIKEISKNLESLNYNFGLDEISFSIICLENSDYELLKNYGIEYIKNGKVIDLFYFDKSGLKKCKTIQREITDNIKSAYLKKESDF